MNVPVGTASEGLTPRDWFAGMALLGLGGIFDKDEYDEIASAAYGIADAMIEASAAERVEVAL